MKSCKWRVKIPVWANGGNREFHTGIEKENMKLKIILAVVAVVTLSLVGYFVYSGSRASNIPGLSESKKNSLIKSALAMNKRQKKADQAAAEFRQLSGQLSKDAGLPEGQFFSVEADPRACDTNFWGNLECPISVSVKQPPPELAPAQTPAPPTKEESKPKK